MTAANAHVMSQPEDEAPGATSSEPVGFSRTWSGAVSDATSFALVGVAAVGFIVETLDMPTDNAQGVLQVGASAAFGAAVSAAYRRLETSTERAARVRLMLWTAIRSFIAFELMRYGVAKVVGMQFYPRYYSLDTRPADMTPMALAWTFFGRTYGYQAMSGVLEIAAAVMLCFRRTTALGACVLLAVMTNVVMLDVFYDVPVKLFSSVYLAMGMYVLAPDARRFWTFFLGDGPVPPRAYLAPTRTRRGRSIATAFVIALVLILPSADIVHKAVQRGIFHTDPLEGAWTVERRAGLDEDFLGVKGSWEKMYFEKGAYGFVRVGGQRVPFKTDIDEHSRTLRLFEIGDPTTCNGTDPRELVGAFKVEGRHLHVDGSRAGMAFSFDLVRDLPK